LSAAYDLVVIGGGIAGLTAAGRAAQAGLRVAVLERGADESYACNSRYSGGILHIAFHNIREPASALLEVIEAATRGKAEPKLAKAFADNAARVVDWLRDEGVEFMSVGNIAWRRGARSRRDSTGKGAARTSRCACSKPISKSEAAKFFAVPRQADLS
jgi:fumarate reductase flavoprotein subunit